MTGGSRSTGAPGRVLEQHFYGTAQTGSLRSSERAASFLGTAFLAKLQPEQVERAISKLHKRRMPVDQEA